MARFLARHAKYFLSARSRVAEHYATGQSKVIQIPLKCQWLYGHVTDEELERCQDTFSFRGQPVEEGSQAAVSIRRNIGIFDTVIAQQQHGWSDQDRKLVEQFLRDHRYNGTKFFESSPPPAPCPWIGYDSLDAHSAIEAVKITGIAPQLVLDYEKENANREQVVVALESLLVGEVDEPHEQLELEEEEIEEEVIVSA